ncbi:MAG TPA: PKD domain-containing protein [Candidatus Paceibacterota bacterium]|jgi:PKD repeat protein|nr:PKD domain-containing protein [Candidatus Paceibacterota bacterium]
MKKINKKLKLSLAVSLLIVALASTPLITSANNDGNNGYQGKAKVEASTKVKTNNSIWSRIFGGLFGNRAKAATKTYPASLSISGITAPTVLKTGQMGTWTVKASDSHNGSLSYAVNWGENDSNMLAKTATPIFVQTSTFTHAYANPGTYTVKFTVTNETGASTSSSTTVHITGKPAPAAPIISDFSATSDKSSRQATLVWKTDVAASSSVWYGTTSPINTSGNPNISRPVKVLNHKVILTGLKPDTKYYVTVGSASTGGATISEEASFTTPAISNSTTPVITSLSGDSKVTVGREATVTVNAYDPNNDSLSYSMDWGDNITGMALIAKTKPVFVQTSTFSHIYNEAGTYIATVTAENSKGLKVSSSTKIIVVGPSDTTNQ